ncbi:ROK family protein [Pedobacter sp.]|jgi:predicted NBD/HSP70 family sugar kinase|uniref:ROK family protein n=1 Tax=Pedobacter sp. TaxID=1411316 RepID=UPI002C21243F|nr:ROK family protein [Pedobacter sp.]HWW43129.1 ROK family protein [Pedobacter sp.]
MPAPTEKSQQLRAEIIKELYHKKVLSLKELSELTKKSLPLVTSVVNSLIEEEYIIEQGLAPSTGGRRPHLFLLNHQKQKFLAAVAMDQMISQMAIYDLSGQSVYGVQQINLDISSPEATNILTDFIEKNLQQSGLDYKDILGVGIGMPGFVNEAEGVNESYLIAEGSNLRDLLTQRLKLPVYLDNDSSLIAMAELRFGASVGKKDVMVVNIGWGTGLGIIVDGKLYRGSTGYAGEFSHIPLSNSNNLCACGKRGCLEVDTSLLVMVDKAKKEISGGAASSMKQLFNDNAKEAAEHFLDAVVKQDPLAVSILSGAAFQIGKGLAVLIHIMNPEQIVLSGRGARAGKMLLPSIQQAINEFCIPRISEQTQIALSKLGEQAELLAAASLLVEKSQFN